jgi:hypothetical protein
VFMSALIGLADSAGGLLYGLAIKGDFKRHQVALDSRKYRFKLFYDMLISICNSSGLTIFLIRWRYVYFRNSLELLLKRNG